MAGWLELLKLNVAGRLDRLFGDEVVPDAATAPFVLEQGAQVAERYRLERVLGEGGMGRVWAARDLVEKRPVALKEMRLPGGMSDVEREASAVLFRREFYAMKKLQHPGTVRVFDAGTLETGDRYLTMEIVDGEDLERLVEKRPLKSDAAFQILLDLAQTLSFIHARLFVHCDIKAENLRLTPQKRLKLMDFGLMHQLGTPASSQLKGTPAYLAPEWPRGAVIDARTDLYSVGVLGFYLVTGRFPFSGKSLAEMVEAHLRRAPPRPSTFTEVDPKLEAILMKLLEKEPRDRYESAAALARALADASGRPLEEEGLAARASYLHVADLVGRERESKVLDERLASLQSGHSRALFIGAPAGVGKSRLLAEFELKAKFAEIPFGLGQCRPEGLAPLAPIKQALLALVPVTPPEVLQKHRPILGKLLPQLAVADAPTFTDPAKEKMAVLQTMAAWVREVALEKPVVLVLEDLHWSDNATIELMNRLIAALDGTRGLFVGTFRSNELGRISPALQTLDEGLSDRIDLTLLSRDDVARLVSLAVAGLAVPSAFIDHLHEKTQGNAFFVTEVLRSLVERSLLSRKGGAWIASGDLGTQALPGTVAETVGARLATLAPDKLRFFRGLAPVGRVLEMALVSDVAGVEQQTLFELLDEGVERQFLQYAEGRYFFTHELVRQTIYDGTEPEAKKQSHGRIATYLERVAGGNAEAQRQIGYHWRLSPDPTRAIDPLMKAGDFALANKALLDATLLLKEAADLLESAPTFKARDKILPGLLGKLVEVGFSGHPPTCVACADKLFGLWAPRIEEGQRKLAPLLAELERGDRAKALPKVVREIAVSDKMGADEMFLKRAELRVLQGVALAAMGNKERVVTVVDDVTREQPEGSPYRPAGRLAHGIFNVHTGRFALLGELAQNVQALRAARDALGKLPRRLSWALGLSGYLQNLYLAMSGRAIDTALTEEGLAIAEAGAFGDLRLHHLNARLTYGCFSGDAHLFDGLRAETQDLVRKLGNPRLIDKNLSIFVPVYHLERKEPEHATAVAEKLVKLIEVLPTDAWLKQYAHVYSVCAAALQGDLDGAAARLPAVVEAAAAANFRHQVLGYATWAHVAARRNDPTNARAAAERAFARATDAQHGSPFDEIIARRAWAAADPARAEHELERALALAVEFRLRLQEGICRMALAEVALHRQGRAAAGDQLQLAEARFSEVNATTWLKDVAGFRARAA
ncbi:MAG: protein kinase [Deltaproteobacteria bacterium]|nr:protein kinase [Deltaproteobacteria bacterium]